MRTAANDHRRRWVGAPWLAVLILVLAGIVGLTAGAARGAGSFTCSMQITTPDGTVVTSAKNGVRLTYTLTVTSTDGTPIVPGTISFWADSQNEVGDDGTLTSFNGNTAQGSVSTAALAPGTYTIVGKYNLGSSTFGTPACQTPPSPLTVGPSGPTQTITTVDLQPSEVDRGSEVTMVARIQQIGNPTAPVGGKVIFSAGQVAHFGDPGGVVVVNNTATITTRVDLPAGVYNVVAEYSGDLNENSIAGSSGEATLVVRDNSRVTYSGPAMVHAGSTATLGGTLTDSQGNPLPGRVLTMSIEGTGATCTTGPADATGFASCTTIVNADAGSYRADASFAGDTYYRPTIGLGSIVVTVGPSTISYDGDTKGIVGRPGTLAATLTTSAGAPIAGAPVSLSVAGHPTDACVATTDGDGHASCPITVAGPAGSFAVNAVYAGDGVRFTGSQAVGQLTIIVSVPTVLTYAGPTATQPAGSTVAPQFTLRDDQGNPVPNVTVAITFNGTTTNVTTDGSGVATAPAGVLRLGGTYPVSAQFGGAPGFDKSGPAVGTVTVAPAPSALTLAPVAPILAGTPATLTGTLVDLNDGLPIANELVTLTVDGVNCTATTSSTGVATCTTTAVAGPARDVQVSGTLAGDVRASGSSAHGAAIVYAFAPGGGVFVIGDQTPTTAPVTFWGAQWWKLNTLSGGSPSSFKGFAGAASASTCGATWTSRPGNSTPPPAGPLPAYLAVVVSSTIAQTGSVSSGDVKRIVVVKTDVGYDSNPGHAGTGTVVATICG